MPNREKRQNLLLRLEELRGKMDIGRGVMISTGYSKEHELLVKAVQEMEDALITYDGKEQLEKEEGQHLSEIMDDVQKKAERYIQAKEDGDKYGLREDKGRGIRKASGDKRARLEAADAIQRFAASYLRDHPLLQGGQENRRHVGFQSLVQTDKFAAEQSRMCMHAQVAEREFKAAVKAYREQDQQNAHAFSARTFAERIGLVSSLHLADLRKLGDDEVLLEKYAESRLQIQQAVDAYKRMKTWKEGKSEAAQRNFTVARLYCRMTEQRFDELDIKARELSAYGKYMDTRIALLQHPKAQELGKEGIKKLEKMDVGELERKSQACQQANPSLSEYLKRMAERKELEELGFGPMEKQRKEGSVLKNQVEKGRTKRYLQLFGGYYKKNLSLGSKVGGKRDLSTQKDSYDTKLFAPVSGKARAFKLSHKFTSKNKYVNTSAHISALTVQGSVAVTGFIKGGLSNIGVQLGASVSASAARAVVKARFGSERHNLEFKVEGEGPSASANAQLGIGKINYIDKDGKVHSVHGAAVSAGAMVSLAKGKVSGGFSLFGISFRAGLEFHSGAIGANAGARITGEEVGVKLGAALGLGFSVDLSVDFSGLKKRFSAWRERCKNRKKLKEYEKKKKAEEKKEKKAEKKEGKELKGGEKKPEKNNAGKVLV